MLEDEEGGKAFYTGLLRWFRRYGADETMSITEMLEIFNALLIIKSRLCVRLELWRVSLNDFCSSILAVVILHVEVPHNG